MKNIILFCSIILLSVFASCKKKEDTKPTINPVFTITGLVDQNLVVPDTADMSLSVKQSQGASEKVTLSAEGLPAYITAAFTNVSGTPPFESGLSLYADKGAVMGTYAVKVNVKGDVSGVVGSFTMNITVGANKDGTFGRDTTYVSAPESQQSRNVFFEQFSGASCINCPDANTLASSLKSTWGDRLVLVNYHTYNAGAIFAPVSGVSKYDFRDSLATQISSYLFGGLYAIPAASIDRVAVGGNMQISQDNWTSQTGSRIATVAPVNLTLNATYSASENTVTVKVHIAYTQTVSADNILTIGVIESGIVDAQAATAGVVPDYVHDYVFRKSLLPSATGLAILNKLNTKESGRVYECAFRFKPSGAWNLDKCRIVAAVSNNSSAGKAVLQAQSVPLK
ncbi:Omp28-related outer membrane protein [Rurimicrobium arvi]|uniref:Omp28-related outer membrane protein n=1 Tax=Rurimicrobium arvi TaxID=2049916 RepID=A0ABP8MW43_9BACT